MFETLAVLGVVLLAAALVFFKARERLGTPGARRSRGGEGTSTTSDRRHDEGAGDGGDGGGGDGGGGGD